MKQKLELKIRKLHEKKEAIAQARRDEFASFLIENEGSTDRESKRASQLSARIEEKVGFAYNAKIQELAATEFDAEKKLLTMLIFLIWEKLTADQQNYYQKHKEINNIEGCGDYEFN